MASQGDSSVNNLRSQVVDVPIPTSAPMPTSVALVLLAPLLQLLAPIIIHLDRDNYPYWRSQVVPTVHAHDLDGFFFGTRPCPPQFLDAPPELISDIQQQAMFFDVVFPMDSDPPLLPSHYPQWLPYLSTVTSDHATDVMIDDGAPCSASQQDDFSSNSPITQQHNSPGLANQATRASVNSYSTIPLHVDFPLSPLSLSKQPHQTSPSQLQHNAAPNTPPNPNTPSHPMITRAKAEPDSASAALKIPRWKSAMGTEFYALLKNRTWILVPRRLGNNNHKVCGIIAQLQQVFSLKKLGSVNYFLGFEITCGSCGIHLSQALEIVERHNWARHYVQPSKELTIECFSDADWAGSIDDRKSTTGYCVYFGGNLINWCSKKQKVVAISSIEVEYRALSQTTMKVA
uniref:Mitochondrial protein n=1 Tax=Cannabis sativa TaxID=3483 RepID=A0A803Q4P5_CANSA